MSLPLRTIAVSAASLLFLIAGLGSGFASTGNSLPDGSSSLSHAATPADDLQPSAPVETVMIPGPLRPLLRMAGISQEVTPAEVLPMLSRNVFLWGYENNRPTEFLVLIDRYVHLARELQALSGSDGVIRVADCDQATRLIQVLGYQFQHGCGSGGAVLITADAERAFVTVDSGFPITQLEDDLQKGKPFACPYAGTPVPVLLNEKTWTGLSPLRKKYGNDLVDTLLHEPSVDRLYSAISRNDEQTNLALNRSPGFSKLLPYASVLDFYGSRISIRSGEVKLPGGPAAEQAWQELVGASPKSSGEFVEHLVSRDHGWLAAYFDAINRTTPAQQAHLVQPARLKTLYEAYRLGSHDSQNSAAEGVFSRNGGLLVLLTRLQWQPDGEPLVPGSLQVWKEILSGKSNQINRRIKSEKGLAADSPDMLLDALAASSLIENGAGPLQIYLMLSAIDSGRPAGGKLSEATARLLAQKFAEYNAWFPVFAEFPALDDSAISGFIADADLINKISDSTQRSNALGAFQAEIGIWQILARQGQIPDRALNQSWQGAIKPFSDVSSSLKLFEASRAALQATLVAAAGDAHLTQDQLIDLLAGPAQDTADGRRAHQELARRIRTVMVDQHLVSLDSLFGLYDGLGELAHGAHIADNLILLAGDLREFELPRPIFSGSEKTTWAPVVYTTRHIELQVRTDLTAIIRNPGSPAELESARARLTPFLRDTLVGLNYAYYEPPGAQVLHNNPLFVRSHDFTAASVFGIEHVWSTPELVGVGVTAGGGTYLLGSLADLPFALASVEQDFITPTKVQALIWREVVPGFLVDSIVPRWWGIKPAEMHAAALYQRTGEELLTASASNPQLKEEVLGILSDRLPPARLVLTAEALRTPESAASLIPKMLPTDTFFLAAGFRSKYPDQASQSGNAGKELDELAGKDPAHANPERLSKDFGLPHLEIAQSNSCSLLNVGIFPASGAFEGRLFAESWESTNLYWARLADDMGYSPAMLNLLVPNLTRRMVANIFATNIDDWPALLRAMERTGNEFKQGAGNNRDSAALTGQISSAPLAVSSISGR
ncbi:MAG: hypothetical protein WA802_01965 [Terracidiphilus sp.]